ncbi:glycoside hydrolase family 2 protein [Deinococcus sonorensis]|uniref:Glycoside hydrolase family 2 TIM barrel-domain containing protein n=2 Tax=Deinococcus sonorensis TaxID=309891 RepID=A0AAU7U4F9_9DEIO
MTLLHPTPQFRRDAWFSLSGTWQFAFDDQLAWQAPDQPEFNLSIEVPFPPESEASGIHDTGFHPSVWYRKEVWTPPRPNNGTHRLRLHFGAVDYEACVWVNGQLVVRHQGGHTPFHADLPGDIGDHFVVVVQATDDPHDLAKPRGKQDWQLEPHEIWYPRTTGIWQEVWLEWVPEVSISRLQWTPHVPRWEVELEASVHGPQMAGLQLYVELSLDGETLSRDHYSVPNTGLQRGEVRRRIGFPDGGIDDARNSLLWSPEHPQLIGAVVELRVGDRVLDRVESYTALRSAGVDQQHFLLNGQPYPLRLVLDQGYWPHSLMTATNDELRQDVELTRMLGFNGARKHQKIEDPRWLYWCDVLGLLVWEELPSAYRFNPEATSRLSREWTEAIERDRSHPCIVAWVPFNESWGVPDLPHADEHRQLVRALYHLTRALDQSRPVIGNDGWESVVTDIIGVHDYSQKPQTLTTRYGTPEATARSVAEVRPGRRRIALNADGPAAPVVLSEFGGVAYSPSGDRGWGYQRSADAPSLQRQYTALLEAIHACKGLAGFCYTQLTDTFQEKNGLLYEDRSAKVPLAVLAQANRGERDPAEQDRDPEMDPMGYSRRWRERQALLAAQKQEQTPASAD